MILVVGIGQQDIPGALVRFRDDITEIHPDQVDLCKPHEVRQLEINVGNRLPAIQHFWCIGGEAWHHKIGWRFFIKPAIHAEEKSVRLLGKKWLVIGGEEFVWSIELPNLLDIFLHHRTVFHDIEIGLETCFTCLVIKGIYAKGVFILEQHQIVLVKGRTIANNKTTLAFEGVVQLSQFVGIWLRHFCVEFLFWICSKGTEIRGKNYVTDGLHVWFFVGYAVDGKVFFVTVEINIPKTGGPFFCQSQYIWRICVTTFRMNEVERSQCRLIFATIVGNKMIVDFLESNPSPLIGNMM